MNGAGSRAVPPRPRLLLAAAILLSLSGWVVYTRFVDLRALDLITNQTYRDLSLRQYRDTLAGALSFPAQWRLLGFWLVRGGERLTGADPHAIDFGLKTVCLAGIALVLFLFSSTVVDAMSALLATALLFLATAIAFAPEAYAIYQTNDYLMLLGWFAAVHAMRRQQWGLAAAAIFGAAWAKETIGLAVILVSLEAWRGRAPWRAVVWCAAAFALPTIILRTTYPAPLSHWAWWQYNLEKNVPFYSMAPGAVMTAVRNDLKLFLFLNLLWLLAARAWWRTADGFISSLGLVLALYLTCGIGAFMFRELRHVLPVMILVLPLAVGEVRSWLPIGNTR